MAIIQRHIPAWDTLEAQRAEAAHELALAAIRDVFKLALVAATALKGVPGIEGSKREIYDRCCDSYLDVYETPANADIGPRYDDAVALFKKGARLAEYCADAQRGDCSWRSAEAMYEDVSGDQLSPEGTPTPLAEAKIIATKVVGVERSIKVSDFDQVNKGAA